MSFRFRRRGDVNDQSPQQEPFFQNAGGQQQLFSENPGYHQTVPNKSYDHAMGGNYNMHPYFQQHQSAPVPPNYPPQPHFQSNDENFYVPQQMQGMPYHPQQHPQQPMMSSPMAQSYAMQNAQAHQYAPNAYMHPVQASQLGGMDSHAYQQPPMGYAPEDVRTLGFWRQSQANSGFEAPESEQEESSPIRLLVAVAGVALIAGLSWFAYKWAKAPSYDAPPLIHADSSPHKVQPDHRGGINIPYQDKLIYDRITDNDGNVEPAEHLLPPPEEPMGPHHQQPMQQMNGQIMGQQPARQPVSDALGVAGSSVYPQMQVQQQMNGQATQQVPVNPQVQQPMASNLAPASSVEIEQDAINPEVSVGSYYVQMVTVKSESAALSEWKRRQKKYNLKGMKSQIKEFETEDGQVFYRLLMGPFPDKVKAMKHAIKMDGSKVVHIAE